MEKTGREITQELLSGFCIHLEESGYAKATVIKYKADLMQYILFLEGAPVCEEGLSRYREYLEQQYRTSSANSKIAAVNAFFKSVGWEYLIPALEPGESLPVMGEELTLSEYRQLLKEAKQQGNLRLYYLIQILSSTKINISEHRYVTVEAVSRGYMVIPRGKRSRVIFIPDRLRRQILTYCKKQEIQSGPVFVNWKGTPLDRSNVHKYLKRLSQNAGVDPEKVNPRSLTRVVEFSSAVYMLDEKMAGEVQDP